LGWYTDATGGEPVTAETIVERNLTLYAHWEPPKSIFSSGAIFTVGDGVLIDIDLIDTTDVVIPSSVTNIDDNVFWYIRDEITSVTIPDSVTNIGDLTFQNFKNLTSVAIGNGVTKIGRDAFYRCSGIRSIVVPQYVCNNSVSSLFPDAYTSITNVVISENVTSIGMAAFAGCSSLTGITIPNSVTNIERWAFLRCDNLELALVPSRLCGIAENSFDTYNSNLQIMYYDDADWVDVTFDANGGYVAPSVAQALKGHVKGYGIGNFPSVSRSGYVFKGWFTDAEGGEQVAAETIVEDNLTLYAHWEKLPVYLWCYAIVESDSLDAIDIVMSIEDRYEIEVPDEVVEKMKTVEDIVNYIESKI
jgi:uncharacterized repeat protein (TIGR02543 family)